MAFNNGKPFHGSEAVENGKLQGRTETQYFYLLCPVCNNGKTLQISEYMEETKEPQNHGFTLAFHLKCSECKFDDFIKVCDNAEEDKLYTD